MTMWNENVWALVRIQVAFEGDEHSFASTMPVGPGQTMSDALKLASDLMMNSFARDAYYRAKEKL